MPKMPSQQSDTLRRPFYATGAELEFYQLALERWRSLPADAVLTEAARLFHFAVAIAGQKAEGCDVY
jgi:hypothetical protein